MKLLLDVGNSRIKWAILQRGGLTRIGTVAYGAENPVSPLIRQVGALSVDRIVAASVRDPDFNEMLRISVQNATGVALEYVAVRDARHGVRVAYSDPARLGVDRFAAMLAARSLNQGANLVVDCGTAVTVDALDAEGSHFGGYILPGLALMRKSLIANTDGIHRFGATASPTRLGIDTASGVAAGTLYGLAYAIDRLCVRAQRELGASATRWICGGDADALLPHLEGDYHHEPALVLRGIALMADER